MKRIVVGIFALTSFILAPGCGGGDRGSYPPPPADTIDANSDVDAADTSKEKDTISDTKKQDQGTTDEITGADIAEISDTQDINPNDSFDVEADSNEVTIPDITEDESKEKVYTCNCDPQDKEHPVCGKDNNTYPNISCAICSLCSSVQGYDRCDGCKGDIENCSLIQPFGDEEGAFLKHRGECSLCVCSSDEKESGPVCGLCTEDDAKAGKCTYIGANWHNGWAKTYNSLCDLKKAIGCPDDPTTTDDFFSYGSCKEGGCPGCTDQVLPVCGTDGITYKNKCWATNCPLKGGTNNIGCGAACLDLTKCPMCSGSNKCDEVCAEVTISGKKTKKTFYNECDAQCQGATVLWHGECCPKCAGQPLKPLCAQDKKGNMVTLSNSCELRCTGFKLLYEGYCNEKCNCEQGDCTCTCDKDGNCSCDCPDSISGGVCGGQYGTTWPDQCWLTCQGMNKLHDGKCTYLCEKCDHTFEPVCGVDKNGNQRTYQNQCFAKCLGATSVRNGVCSNCKSMCGTPDNPKGGVHEVCGKTDHVTYPNACFAKKCTLVNDYTEGACE